jgi:OOP family OmpA-OmpF porin
MSMYSSLVGMLDKSSLGGIASALGESEQSVSRGMESSIAAVLGGLAAKSEDPNSLRKILDFVPSTLGAVTGSQMASSVANPDSPLLSAGKRCRIVHQNSDGELQTAGIEVALGLLIV